MRWRTPKFALIAAIPLILAAMSIAPAHADPAPTTTVLTWEGRSSGQTTPTDVTNFYATVSASSCPTGTVKLFWNGNEQPPPKQLGTCTSDGKDPQTFTARTPDIPIDLRNTTTGQPQPNYFRAHYFPSDPTKFVESLNDLGIGIPSLTANPEPSQDGQIVIYTFTLWVSAPAGSTQPSGRVNFHDDQGHDSGGGANDPLLLQAPGDNTHFNATWRTAQSFGRSHTTAHFSPDAEPYLAADAFRDHNVNPAPATPGETTPPASKATPTTKAPVPRGKTPTTAALAPISGSTSTTPSQPAPSTTNETFGEFQSPPPTTGNAALADNKSKKQGGPPLAVVVMTLGALGILGGIGAVRRYRRPSDWL